VTFGPERTFEQDPGFALRILADIALRALSPAVNDPTTAVQALDSIDSLLAERDLDIGRVVDKDGFTRVEFQFSQLGGLCRAGARRDHSFGVDSRQVTTRVERLLTELSADSMPERSPPLQRRIGRVATDGG
jgi:uncharacterized membrane protein